jgi:hypothetical protein
MNEKGCERKHSWPNLSYSLGIYMEELRKKTKDLSQDSMSSGREVALVV